MSNIYFDDQTFSFLKKLAKNNNHEWFRAHKEQYEEYVRTPALQLIRDLQPDLLDVSEHFVASEKKVGGSLFRVMKDTRFEHPEGGMDADDPLEENKTESNMIFASQTSFVS